MPPSSTTSKQDTRRKHVAIAASLAGASIVQYYEQMPQPIPKRTSILTGRLWLDELLEGHPEHFWEQFGLSQDAFHKLLAELVADHGLCDGKYVTAPEQLAIFLHFSRTGLTSRLLQERFQHSGDTISKYIYKIMNILVGSFYAKYVTPLPEHETPSHIHRNSKYFPFFKYCRGAIDGSHVLAFIPGSDAARYRNRKGTLSQNVLAVSDFDLKFTYVLSGWDGSAADSRVFDYARNTDLSLPNRCYFLADAGFPLCDMLLTPYRGKRYHLNEWGQAGQRPKDYQELFNLRHATARNVVEHIFGVFKHRFGVMKQVPEYPIEMQAKLIPALAGLHNFLVDCDPIDDDDEDEDEANEHHLIVLNFDEIDGGVGGRISNSERTRAEQTRDAIAKAMWQDYLAYI